MPEELKTATAWAKELAIPEKRLKDAIKLAGLEPDAKKGVCGYYAQTTIEKARKGIK